MVLFKALTGSRLHGLCTPESDYDWKSVTVSSLKDIVSPFKKQKGKETITETEDNCVYELQHFAKLLADCNPTVLEMLWARDFDYKHPLAEELIQNRKKLLRVEKVYYAHRGFASDQREKLIKGSSFNRQVKALTAYIRIMKQGISLLKTGDFNPVVKEAFDDKWYNTIYQIRYHSTEEDIINIGLPLIQELEEELTDAFNNCTVVMNPNVEWLEEFLLKAYLELGIEKPSYCYDETL